MAKNNESLDEIFDSMLKAALIERSMRRSANYPATETLAKTTHMSKRCDQRARRAMNWFYYKEKLDAVYRFGKKCAIIAIVTLSTTLGALLLGSQEVRASILDVIIEIYEQFLEFRNETRDRDLSEYKLELGYLPDGYSLSEEVETSLFIRKKYVNEKSETIEIWAYLNGKYAYQIDNEVYNISPCNINGYSGRVFMSKKGGSNIITWYNGDVGMYLEAYLSKKELIKIAKKIK